MSGAPTAGDNNNAAARTPESQGQTTLSWAVLALRPATHGNAARSQCGQGEMLAPAVPSRRASKLTLRLSVNRGGGLLKA